MPMFHVTIPMVLTVQVEANDREQARDQAFEWARWIDPTDEQLEDFKEDRENGVRDAGVLEINGAAEIEETV